MMMFINPMLMLAAENMIERSFENRNPTLFAIGAGMFGVGAVGWAGTKAFVKKESKAKKPAAKAFRIDPCDPGESARRTRLRRRCRKRRR